tara:strand:+ start:359 stop:820 length:462 start_codon:yes stop_codon:yes gene_type:complete
MESEKSQNNASESNASESNVSESNVSESNASVLNGFNTNDSVSDGYKSDSSESEGEPIKNGLRVYYEKDYYHSVERFCDKNKNLYLHCIARKPRFVENNELSYDGEPQTVDGTHGVDGSQQDSFYENFTNNCSNILNSWFDNCKYYMSNTTDN